MAFGLKYIHRFNQIKQYGSVSTEWEIRISQEGFNGSTSTFDVDRNSINLSREGDLLTTTQGTTLTFSIINKSEGEFKEFRDANWGEYVVVLLKDPDGDEKSVFTGYNQSEIYTEPYDQPPYSSVLEFTCGLNHLRHVKWDDEGSLYVGQKSMIEVIRLALNKLPNPLPIREIVNIYEDSINSTTTDSMLNQIFVDSSVYKKKTDEGSEALEVAFNCREALDENLKVFGVNLYQANSIWYIVRVQEYMDSTIHFRDFNANVGTEDVITIDGIGNLKTNKREVTGPNALGNELILVAPESELSIDPPLNRVQITYNQTNIDQEDSDWIKNGCWDDRITNTLTPSFWDFTGSDPSTYTSLVWDGNGNGYQRWMMLFKPSSQATSSSYNNSIYIEQTKTNIPVSTLDSLLFSFKNHFQVLISGTGSSTPVINWMNDSLELIYEVEIKVGIFYLRGDSTIGYSWVPSVGNAIFKFVGGYAQNSGSSSTSFNYSCRWWREVSQVLPVLPQTGFVDIRIRIYQPYSNSHPFAAASGYTASNQIITQACFSLIYLPLEAAPTEELIINSVINEDEKLEEIDVLHADGTNSGTLNSFRTSNGLITNEWTRRGLADDTDILTLFLKQLADMRGDFVREISGKLIGEIDVFNTVEHATDLITSYYIKTYNWSIETSEYSVTLSELGNSALPVVILKEPISSPVNPDPSDDDEQLQKGSKFASTSDGSIVSKSSIINPNQSDLNNFI